MVAPHQTPQFFNGLIAAVASVLLISYLNGLRGSTYRSSILGGTYLSENWMWALRGPLERLNTERTSADEGHLINTHAHSEEVSQ